jgi:hypothetical protein
MNHEVRVDASDVLSDLKMDVVITGRWKMGVRVWVATRLFQLAAWVLGASMDVNTEQDPQ